MPTTNLTARGRRLTDRSTVGESSSGNVGLERAAIVLITGPPTASLTWKKTVLLLRELGHDVFVVPETRPAERLQMVDRAIDLEVSVSDDVELFEIEHLTAVTLVFVCVGSEVVNEVAERVPERLKQVIDLQGTRARNGQRVDEAVNDDFTGIEIIRTSVEGFIRWFSSDPVDEEWLLSSHPRPHFELPIEHVERFEPATTSLRLVPIRPDDRGTAA